MPLEKPSVQKVSAALIAAGLDDKVQALSETARTAQDAADALAVPLGAIAKSLVFMIGDQAVLALVAGDRQCILQQLAPILGFEGKVKRATADQVRLATGFAIGGVAPIGHSTEMPIALDQSLSRFDRLFAAAGHPHCVFETTFLELQTLTKAVVSDQLSQE